MEISNSKKCLGLVLATMVGSCFFITACTSDETPNLTNQIEEENVITLTNGEKIILEDTTVYEINPDDVISIDTCNQENDFFTDITRGSSDIYGATGYDKEEAETGWKKYSLGNGWAKYGINKGTYLARYVKVHKNLSILPNTIVVPANYNSTKAPTNAMGWLAQPNLGFSATVTDDYTADGVTRVFYIKCTLSGVSYNKYIPATPSNFIWTYKLTEIDDMW